MELKVIKQNVMKVNEDISLQTRQLLKERGCLMANLISSPGSGKTSLLEKIVPGLAKKGVKIGVIEGDCYTTRDAERIHKLNVPVVQINTEGDCHLESSTVNAIIAKDIPADIRLLFVENVGNLVCPAVFDLGEDFKIAVLSVPEGSDKPVKYPMLFQGCGLVILNKTDLIKHTNFDKQEFYKYLKTVNPSCRVIETSCSSGEGIDEVIGFIFSRLKT